MPKRNRAGKTKYTQGRQDGRVSQQKKIQQRSHSLDENVNIVSIRKLFPLCKCRQDVDFPLSLKTKIIQLVRLI